MIKLMILVVLSISLFGEQLGTIKTSGMIFKDTLEIHAFGDPTIFGVTCYVTFQNVL